MRDFSRERPLVNEDFGNDIAKTSPLFAVDTEALRADPAKKHRAAGN
jgi:hypothetical protein